MHNGCKHSLAPKNRSEIAFQVLFCFYWGLKQVLVSVSIDKAFLALNRVTLLMHFNHIGNVFDVI